MSAVYYERIEQGRGPTPSAPVLAGLADAFRLTADERNHLYTLAGQAPPAAPARGFDVDPGLEYVLRAVADTTPASVTDDLSNVLAQNWLNTELFGQFAGLPGRGCNLIWRWFTSPRWRLSLEPPSQHEGMGEFYVADLRAAVARRGHDREAVALVDELRQVSAEFARMWDKHHASALYCTTKTMHDARVGQLDLDCAVVTSPLSDQRLLLLQPTPGTPTGARLEELGKHRLARHG
jgi:transcriptional regulator with XRE-family HTH domain